MTNSLSRFATAFSIGALALLAAAPAHADRLLSGTVLSASGDKIAGATVSAKADGSPITTTVFTDEQGNYYFPDMPSGKYRVWAQAVTFDTGRGEVDLASSKHQDFKLAPMKDYTRQLTGDVLIASLPADTPDDARIKRVIRNNCTGCHTPNYPLQHRFDEQGWTAIIDLMKHINVLGIYQGPEHKANPILESHREEIAKYLARARGPGESSMKLKLRPRPTGEAARVVFREYDVPVDPGLKLPYKYALNDGSDWSLGAPSGTNGTYGVHDAQQDLDGNIWFTHSQPSHEVTYGRIDAKTGETKFFKVANAEGGAAVSHGIIRDPKGIIWLNVGPTVMPRHGGLGRIDPKTQKLEVFLPPAEMSGTGGSLDFDGKGKIWITAPDGAFRFDPDTKEFTEFKSVTYKTPNGTGTTYGIAADRNGNGWWAEMTIDIIAHGDIASKKASEIRLPPEAQFAKGLKPEEEKLYATFAPPDFNTVLPWAQGPRRMGSDKNGNTVWIGDSWGGNYARIDIDTGKQTYVPLPDPVGMQPYHVTVDDSHGVWTNLWTADAIIRLDPATNTWTTFDLPTHGGESRYMSILEKDGRMSVTIPQSRARKVAVMTFRSAAEMDAAKRASLD
ncbi:MAG: carboxypeptidase regulatory-like domain-containing protein [Gemmatimonas sp.]